jgi:hypothetical protein
MSFDPSPVAGRSCARDHARMDNTVVIVLACIALVLAIVFLARRF